MALRINQNIMVGADSCKHWNSNKTQNWHPPSQVLNHVELLTNLCELFPKNGLATARYSNFLIVRFARNNEIWQSQWESNPCYRNENPMS